MGSSCSRRTRFHQSARAKHPRAESHDSPADRNCPECGPRARSMFRGKLRRERMRASSLTRRQNIVFFFRFTAERIVRRFCKTRTMRGQRLAANWRNPFTSFAPTKHRFSVTVITVASPYVYLYVILLNTHAIKTIYVPRVVVKFIDASLSNLGSENSSSYNTFDVFIRHVRQDHFINKEMKLRKVSIKIIIEIYAHFGT